MNSILGVVACWLGVDFVSGLVHWAEDTFGTERTPVLGPWVVAPNVEHHRNGSAFVHKSWLASNWDLGLVGLILVVVSCVGGWFGPGVAVFALAGANANQIHKWCHAPGRAPWFVRVLWWTRLLQRPAHHGRHHSGDKNTAYCVVTPILNPVLDGLGFWRALERVVVPFTGAPRREDLRHLRVFPWARGASRS